MNPWRNIWTITKRELGAYFSSPIAYVFIVIFLLLCGFFTFTTYLGSFFERCEVLYDTAFLRWDRTKTTQLLEPLARVWTAAEHSGDPLLVELARLAGEAAGRSVDWWRQVGAAMRLAGGETLTAVNEHSPHPLSAYAAGDPRANLYKGVGLELSTATHAEAALIARAARDGKATAGATMFVSDFPCPPCAKLIAGAGVAKLYFVEGYAVLDGEDVLACAGVEVVRVG